MASLIPSPVLDARDEELIAAQAIARVSGGWTLANIDKAIETLRQLRVLVAAGNLAPVCPELTNANTSSPHTVLLETMAWLVGLQSYKINQLPVRDQIEFARLFGVELRQSTAAITTLTFTVAPPAGVAVNVPAGTQIATADGTIVFTTNAALVIPAGTFSGSASATRNTTGVTLLAANQLTRMIDTPAWVTNVTNLAAIDSGTDAETVDSALDRARSLQRRGERIVSAQDLEDAVLHDILQGNGIVKAFPFINTGDFTQLVAGHTTLVVMTRTGDPIGGDVKVQIDRILAQEIGSQFVYLLDPQYITFDVTASVRLTGLIAQAATLAAIERNLRSFYAPSMGNFGRPILRAEIIAVIEGTDGVLRIEAPAAGAILTSPLVDMTIAPYAFPQLVNVTLNAV